MTGFTNCLRKCFKAPAADWKPLRQSVDKGDAEKITVKITAAAEGRDQIGATDLLNISADTCCDGMPLQASRLPFITLKMLH